MSRRTESSLRLATWNIHSGIGGDHYFDMGRILSVLEEIDADVVGLQEVGWHRRTHHRIDQFSRSEEHTSELQSLMRISYAVFCLKKKINTPSTKDCTSSTHT